MGAFGMGESPGSIRNQVGRSLNLIRECVQLEDVDSLANHLRYLIALCSPLLEGEKLEEFRVKDSENESAMYEGCMVVLEKLLPILANKGYYAKVVDSYNDGSSIALTDDEAPTVPVE